MESIRTCPAVAEQQKDISQLWQQDAANRGLRSEGPDARRVRAGDSQLCNHRASYQTVPDPSHTPHIINNTELLCYVARKQIAQCISDLSKRLNLVIW